MGYDHPDPEPEIVIEEAPDTEPVAAAEVEVARIEADRDVTIARIENRVLDDELMVRVAALEAENEALRAQLAPPEPEPVPVVVSEPAPDPGPDPGSVPPSVEETSAPAPAAKKRGNPWW